MSLPWYRMYAKWATDPVVQSLAFEDQRHHAVLMCLKRNGTLDHPLAAKQRELVICRGLGLDPASAAEAKRRLMEIGLIDKNWQPTDWEETQYLPEKESGPGNPGYVYFIGAEGAARLKIGYSKNPWARIKEFQTGNDEKLYVLATAKTTTPGETDIARLFINAKLEGDWYTRTDEINQVIKALRSKQLLTAPDVSSYVQTLRSSDVVTTTEQSQNRTELEVNNSPASQEPRSPAKPNPPTGTPNVWDVGKSLLAAEGLTSQQAGSFIGKLIKQHGESAVHSALAAASLKRPAELRQWLTGTLRTQRGHSEPSIYRKASR